jgi:hypothetical protein
MPQEGTSIGFNEAKFIDELLDHLKAHHLAWPSHHSRAYGHRNWYALHPVLSRAIMTTLGLSIASEQRYDLVTAEGAFHEALLATKAHAVFDVLLRDDPNHAEQTRPQARQDLAQRVVFLTGVNYEALHPKSIPELQASMQFQSFQRVPSVPVPMKLAALYLGELGKKRAMCREVGVDVTALGFQTEADATLLVR